MLFGLKFWTIWYPFEFFWAKFLFPQILALFMSFFNFFVLSDFPTLLVLSSLTGLSCFMKVKWKMQLILCFLKCASKSLKSQSLNFPLPNKSFFNNNNPYKVHSNTSAASGIQNNNNAYKVKFKTKTMSIKFISKQKQCP